MAGFEPGSIPTYNLWSGTEIGESGTVWDDLRVALEGTKTGGSKDPDFSKVLDDGGGSQGVFAWHFDKALEEELYFSVQFPHAWRTGSVVEPHVHWLPKTTHTGVARWGLEYSWADLNATFSNTTIIYAEDAGDGVALKHQYASFRGVTPSGINIVSSMMLCRLFRDATHLNDTFDADAIALEFDIHFRLDAVGSRNMLTKE